MKSCGKAQTFNVNGTNVKVNPTDYIYNPYYGYNITQAQLNSEFPLTGYYPTYANFFPYALQTGDGSTIIAPNVFSSWVSWKKNKFQATLTGNLWEGTQYGAPTEIAGTNPTSCTANQGFTGIVPGSQNADYQTCASSIAIPNPSSGQFDNIGQYRNPWQLNLGAQLGYDFTPRVRGTILFANILNACFGGSAEPWTAAYAPNSVICAYAPNSTYIGATPGAGYFYGNSGHSSANGSGTYPKLFDQAYAPTPNQISRLRSKCISASTLRCLDARSTRVPRGAASLERVGSPLLLLPGSFPAGQKTMAGRRTGACAIRLQV